MAEPSSSDPKTLNVRSPKLEKRGCRGWIRRHPLLKSIRPAILVLVPLALHSQTVSTVREVEFRSRWSNYQVDQPRVERAQDAALASGEAEPDHGVVPVLRSLFRTGPIVVRGSVTSGWEYSNEHLNTGQSRATSESSFFTAPAVAASYDREVGPMTVSFRYSAGYLRYLDQNFSPAGGSAGGLSQTAGLDVARQGSRLAFRLGVSATSGSGYDIERNAQTDRTSFAAAFAADYSLTEFTRVGASLNAARETYSNAGIGTDDSQDRWSATVHGEYVMSGKTTMRLEFGVGQESQLTGEVTSRDRSYYQGLLRVKYQPTAKLTLTPALGFGVLKQTGQTSLFNQTPDGFRALYSLGVDYAPTEKTAVRLFLGIEGAAVQPELSLAVTWHPRANTLVNLSVYQQSGLSTIAVIPDRTRRGALLSLQQHFFQRMDAGLSVGWEKEEWNDTSAPGAGATLDPYYFVAANLAWEFNSWLTWQAQSRLSSGRGSSAAQNDASETRASVSFRLTF